METVFSKILEGKLPSYTVYEDDETFAFLDLFPSAKGHILVIPKNERVANFSELSASAASSLILTTQKMVTRVKERLKCEGVNIQLAEGSAAGQEVMHVHMHVIPRFCDDGLNLHHKTDYVSLSEDEFKEICSQLV